MFEIKDKKLKTCIRQTIKSIELLASILQDDIEKHDMAIIDEDSNNPIAIDNKETMLRVRKLQALLEGLSLILEALNNNIEKDFRLKIGEELPVLEVVPLKRHFPTIKCECCGRIVKLSKEPRDNWNVTWCDDPDCYDTIHSRRANELTKKKKHENTTKVFCKGCGKEFTPTHLRQKFCSPNCCYKFQLKRSQFKRRSKKYDL